MFNLKSLWRHYDVIFEKPVKRWASLAQISIFIDPVPQIIFFMVDILNYGIIFHKVCQKKQTFWNIVQKWDRICHKKPALSWWRHQNKGNVYYFKPNCFGLKQYQCFCQAWIGLDERWRSSTYLNIDCFQQFWYSTQQRWHQRRHSDVIMDLTVTAFERFCAIALSCQVWW